MFPAPNPDPLPRLEDEAAPAPNTFFATTHWSVIVQAAELQSPHAADALERLCRAYWHPVFIYVRSRGHELHDAQDLTQEFFSSLLERNALAAADRTKGRFRQFLLGSLKHFLANEWDRAKTVKRGGRCSFLSWDELTEDSGPARLPPGAGGENVYERQWAFSLLEQVGIRLRDECKVAGKSHLYEALRVFLSVEQPEQSYATVGAPLGLSAGTVQVAVHRLRRRYGELLREEIGNTVSDPREIDDEIRYLFSALRG